MPLPDYDVRVCLGRCGFEAAFVAPEIKRCPNCGAMLGAIPGSLVEEFAENGAGGNYAF